MTRRLPLVLLLASVPLFAQNGDRPNETQAPPPADLVIPPAPVLLAEEALKTIQVAPGYRLEIAAADPLVGDPVAINFGPDGRLWVVEMRGFMPNPDGKGEDAKVGTVAVLEDTDHDGRMDKRTVFLDGLVLPRALALVGDGVLVAEPPHLWFARDTNGDGRADEKTEIASDYGATDNPEHTANSLYRAMDNWIYSANHTVRFRYRGNGKFDREFTIMRGQWGLSQDRAGRLFYNTNSDPLRYDAVPSHYFTRQPGLTDPAGLNVQIVPANLRIWPLRVTPGVNRGYQTLDATGRITAMTAACAPLIYRGTLLPDLRNDAFVCEPSGNLIKRITLDRRGDLLAGHNTYQGTEFIASTDERFRPVNLAEGPDGSLYIVDMYRGIIQHRIYLTSYLRKQIESRGLAEGMGMGRIYRIVPESGAKKQSPVNLLRESSTQLIEHLASHDAWWRDTAQRLLVERRDPSATPLLRVLAANPTANPFARLHALWTLEGLGGLDHPTLWSALDSDDDAVRAAAIRLSEPLLAGDGELPSRLAAIGSPSTTPHNVVVQACLSLGESRDARTLPILLDLARRHGARPVIPDAIVSSLAGREVEFITLALGQPDPASSAATVTLAASCVWRSGDAARTAALDRLFGTDTGPAWGFECLLSSLKAIVPEQRGDKLQTVRLGAAPTTLMRLAESNDLSFRARISVLLSLLRWPGNEEQVAAVAPLTPDQEKFFEKGRTIFTTICAGCHQPTGLGLKGLAPSLVNSKWVAGDARALARIVLQGKSREGSVMPPLGALDDESLAGALTFIRRSWGHGFDPVEPAVIARARAETAGRAEPWTEKSLAKFLEEIRVGTGPH